MLFNNQRHQQGEQHNDDNDEVAWVALELQKKALHRLLFRMDQDDKKRTSNKSSSESSSALVSSLEGKKKRQLGGSNQESGNFRKSFTIIDISTNSDNDEKEEELKSLLTLEGRKENGISEQDLKRDENCENSHHGDEGKISVWMKLWKFIERIVKSATLMKSLGWISVSSLATISLIKFLSVFLSLFNSHSSHVHDMSNNNSLMVTKKQSRTVGMPSYLIPPPIFQSIDNDDIPRSVKGRFYLHELSTLQEQFQNDGVYGNISTSNSSSSKNHLEEGPLFIPITNIERFQEQRQKTKYSPSDIDGDINKNGLFGQMVQLESYRKSTVFNGD